MLSWTSSAIAAFVGQWQVALVGLLAGGGFKALWEAIGREFVCWLNMWMCSFLRVFLSRVVTYLTPALDLLPQMGDFDVSPIAQWWFLVDYYVPLNVSMTGLGVTWAFVLLVRIFRFIKQFIPTVAN